MLTPFGTIANVSFVLTIALAAASTLSYEWEPWLIKAGLMSLGFQGGMTVAHIMSTRRTP